MLAQSYLKLSSHHNIPTNTQDTDPKGFSPFDNTCKECEVSVEVPMGTVGTRFLYKGRGTLPFDNNYIFDVCNFDRLVTSIDGSF